MRSPKTFSEAYRIEGRHILRLGFDQRIGALYSGKSSGQYAASPCLR
jgi:hypothetical protein